MSYEDAAREKIKKIYELATSKAVKNKLGNYTKEIIYNRTKSGKGVSTLKSGAIEEDLDDLSTKYENYREKNKSKLGKFGAPKRSNATFTGQMLEAIKRKATNKGFEVYIDSSSRDNSKLTNKQVAGYYQKKRKFFNLTETEINNLKFEFSKILRRIIKRVTK